jgi:Holliday junction DNA helicase RuvA
MIASLTGTITARDEKSVVLDVHGVGLRVFILPRTLEKLPLQTTATLVTHLNVREDALDLYGFMTAGELRLFERLISVSGVGPKVALGVMSAADASDLEAAIERGDSKVLTKVSGVGTKTAERIIVDLRGKLSELQSRLGIPVARLGMRRSRLQPNKPWRLG